MTCLKSQWVHYISEHAGKHTSIQPGKNSVLYVLRLTCEKSISTARSVHHQALISSDVERTIDFYQGLLGFPLTELFENRDYEGSTHFFFDIGKEEV